MILAALLMVTRITGLGISFSQLSDVLRSPRRAGGEEVVPSLEAPRVLAARARGGFPSPNTAGLHQHRYTIPSFPGPLSSPHRRHLRPSSTPPPRPFVSFSDGCFQSQVVFFLPHKTLRSRADHRLDRGLGFLQALCCWPASLCSAGKA